jgi:CDP-glycerol glycerophosphotransferase (TagB/SpsB family)
MNRVLLNWLLRPVDRVLQVLMPVSSRRVCYFSRPDYGDNSYYVYRHILTTRREIEHIWLVLDMSQANRMMREFRELTQRAGITGHTLRIVKQRSLAGYFLHLTCHYVFHTHGIYSISNWAFRRKVISLWHGMPIKCIGSLNHKTPNPHRPFGTTYIASSHFFKYIIACAFEVAPESVAVCGLPRCDALQHEIARGTARELVRERLGIPEGKKIVLWMPTYRTESSAADNMTGFRSFLDDLAPWVIPGLMRHCALSNCILVVKLHPKDLLNHGDLQLGHEHLMVLKSKEWLAHEIQLYDLIASSDALLSDVSSVLIDYLSTDRPIGIVGFDLTTYTRELTFPAEILLLSKRYHHLTDDETVMRFFDAVVKGEACTEAPHDLSSMLYERSSSMGAEAVLCEVGL